MRFDSLAQLARHLAHLKIDGARCLGEGLSRCAELVEIQARAESGMGLPDSISHEIVGETEAIVGSTDPKAVHREFGTEGTPPQPFLGPALFKNIETIKAMAVRAAFKKLSGDYDDLP